MWDKNKFHLNRVFCTENVNIEQSECKKITNDRPNTQLPLLPFMLSVQHGGQGFDKMPKRDQFHGIQQCHKGINSMDISLMAMMKRIQNYLATYNGQYH